MSFVALRVWWWFVVRSVRCVRALKRGQEARTDIYLSTMSQYTTYLYYWYQEFLPCAHHGIDLNGG